MLCNISQNAMGQPLGGGVPCQVQLGGGGVPDLGTPPAKSAWGDLTWVPPLPGYPPSQVRGGTLVEGGYLTWVPPRQGTPPAGGGGGVPRSGQHREYLLHGGRYASCVHAGGLSCY